MDFPSKMKDLGSVGACENGAFLVHVREQAEAQACSTHFVSEEHSIRNYGLFSEAKNVNTRI